MSEISVDQFGTPRASGICSNCGGEGILVCKPHKPGRETMTCPMCDGPDRKSDPDRLPDAKPHFREAEQARVKAALLSDEAVRALAAHFFSYADESLPVFREALEAALPAIRQAEQERVREALKERVALISTAPSSIVRSEGYQTGRADERTVWLEALDALAVAYPEEE